MLIESFELEIFTPPCEPGAERFAAKARLTIDISDVQPLLNARLRGAVYHRPANALTWKKGGHNIAFHAFEIGTSNVEDRDGAEKELQGLVDLVTGDPVGLRLIDLAHPADAGPVQEALDRLQLDPGGFPLVVEGVQPVAVGDAV